MLILLWPHRYGAVTTTPTTRPPDGFVLPIYEKSRKTKGLKKRKKKLEALTVPEPVQAVDLVQLAIDDRQTEIQSKIADLETQIQIRTLQSAIQLLEARQRAELKALWQEEAERQAIEAKRLKVKAEHKRIHGILKKVLADMRAKEEAEDEEFLMVMLAATYSDHYEIIPMANKK